MTKWKLATLVAVTAGLVVPASGGAARPKEPLSSAGTVSVTTATSVYAVNGLTVPGIDTGRVLDAGSSVTVIASGGLCPWGDGGACYGPDGTLALDTIEGGWVLPGAPAAGLVGRVGDGPWVQVGSGPTTLTGTGSLVFAVNDRYGYFWDNTGGFTATVTVMVTGSSSSCFPGWGNGDVNHSHDGPPGAADTCYPGNGFGDVSRVHAGPPGLSDKADSGNDGNGKSKPGDDEHSSAAAKSQGHGKKAP
jgi:hypothetical protein